MHVGQKLPHVHNMVAPLASVGGVDGGMNQVTLPGAPGRGVTSGAKGTRE